MKKVETESGRPCNLGIWDTAGQERFDSLSSFYCRGARAAIICYDLTDRASFECLQQKWIRKVKRALCGNTPHAPNARSRHLDARLLVARLPPTALPSLRKPSLLSHTMPCAIGAVGAVSLCR